MASRLGVLGIISVVLCSVYCEEDWVAMRMYRADAEETDALGQGSCQYGYTSEGWPNGLYASISRDDTKWSPNEMRGCGTCLEVSCQDVEACGPDPTKSITVVITSECPTCSGTELQLSAAAFDALVHTQTGRAQSRVRMVPCSPPGNIQIRVSDARDTKGGWLKLEVESLAGSGILFGVEVRGKDDDSWRPMTQTSGAAWEMSMLPFPPLDVRVTASDGQVVLPVAIPAIKAGLYPTEVQLAPTEQAPNPRAEAPFRLDRDPEVVGDGVVRFATPLSPAKGPAVETMPVSPAQGPAAEESPPSRATPRPGPPLNANEDAGAPAVDWSSRRLDEAGAPENSPGVPLLQRRQDNEVEGGEGTVDAGSAQGEELPFIERAPMTEDEMPVDAAPSLEDQVASLNGQPGVVPAPVSFQPLKITRMSRGPDTRGYISSKQVQDDYNVTREGGCPTLQDLLGSSPDLSIWFQLLRFSGLVNMLQDGNAVVTLFVPVNSAFEAVLNAPSFLAAPETLAEFVRTRPELVPILTSYSTASHLWPLASLFEGEQVPTMASADKTNKIPIHVEAGDRLRGVGSSATILQGNLLACGPAVVHVIDQVLLPFGLEKQAIDAISDSQVKSSPTPVSPPAV